MKMMQKAAVLAVSAFLAAGLCVSAASNEAKDMLEDVLLEAGTLLTDADGSAQKPYPIDSVADLQAISNTAKRDPLKDVHFVQTADIVAGASDVLAPIGSSDMPFQGYYDGASYSISSLTLEADAGVSGLFGYTDGATIKNVRLVDASMSMTGFSGGICANASGGTVIENCAFDGVVTLESKAGMLGSRAGGIAGWVSEDSKVISCKNTAAMQTYEAPFVLYIGGVVGSNAGTVSECVNSGDITTNSTTYLIATAGVVGSNTGTVYGCENTGIISGYLEEVVSSGYVGGIVGHNDGGTVSHSENYGDVEAVGFGAYPTYVGGLVGYNYGGTIETCLNGAVITSSVSSYTGGIAGVNLAENASASINNTLHKGSITVTDSVAGGLVGANIASANGSEALVRASMNLDKASGAKAVYGEVTKLNGGASTFTNVYAYGKFQASATTVTENNLLSQTSFKGLENDAWLYPQNGFFPTLAVVKNLDRPEVMSIAVDSSAAKVAFALYNPNAEKSVSLIAAFYDQGRLIGTAAHTVTASTGYQSYVIDSEYAANADDVRVVVLESLSGIKPIMDMETFAK